MKTLLKNGTVVSGDMSVREDVLIDGEKIVKVGRNLEAEDAQVVDVNGKLLFPGFIDGHTHFDLILKQEQELPLQEEQLW